MNTHLKQLWAAMKLPKNFKKSYKFFCLGLDIRVSESMYGNLRYPTPSAMPGKHIIHSRIVNLRFSHKNRLILRKCFGQF